MGSNVVSDYSVAGLTGSRNLLSCSWICRCKKMSTENELNNSPTSGFLYYFRSFLSFAFSGCHRYPQQCLQLEL